MDSNPKTAIIKQSTVLTRFKNSAGDTLNTVLTLSEDKLKLPYEVSINSSVITVATNVINTLKTNGSNSTTNANTVRDAVIDSKGVATSSSTLDVFTGVSTGDFEYTPITCPPMSLSYYIQMGIERRANGKLNVVFGAEAVDLATTTAPNFTRGALQICVFNLKDDGTGGTWNFIAPTDTTLDLIRLGSTQTTTSPFRVYASIPATSKIYFDVNEVADTDGAGLSIPPISSLVPTVAISSYDLQTGATTGNTFSGATIPSTTVGHYRRVGFSLLADGTIQTIWSSSSATFPGTLPNPGTLFVRGGLAGGWLDLIATGATAFKTIGSATSVIEPSVGGVSRLHRFGSGGGAGSGSGDANATWEDMKDYLDELPYEYLEGNIGSLNEGDKLDGSSTMTYDIASQTFMATAGSQNLVSTNHLNQEFIDSRIDIPEVAIRLAYDIDNIDTNPSVYFSRNGGATAYQQATVERIGVSNSFVARHTFTVEALSSLATLYSPTAIYEYLSDVGAGVSGSDQYGVKIGQEFTRASDCYLQQLTFQIHKVGSPTGRLFVSVVKDDTSLPSEAADKTLISSLGLDIGALITGDTEIIIPIQGALPIGTYHLLFETDASYKSVYTVSNRIGLINTASGSNAEKFDGTTWTTSGHIIAYKLEGRVMDLRVKVTSSVASKISGYGVYYGNSVLGYSKPKNVEVFDLSTAADVTTLTLTKFVPDIDLVTVYVPSRGQVFKAGAFSLSGNSLIFDSGFFYELPDTQLRVIVEQKDGISYDNSDRNGNLLATNHLGSPDSNYDMSVPGRGIYLKSPDGTLYEITIKDGGIGFDIYEITA